MAKKRTKSASKYFLKYGYSIREMSKITGICKTTVHKYLQKPQLRKMLFAEIKTKLEQVRKKKKKSK